jgi:hypothetical protein
MGVSLVQGQQAAIPSVPYPLPTTAAVDGCLLEASNRLMSRDAAVAIIRKTGWMIDSVKAEAENSIGWPAAFDPDITNKRSWSESFKRLQQRNREIERRIDFMLSERGPSWPSVDKLFDKLMWGRDRL